MNGFLLSLGIALVLALTAAVAAPFFIDWSSQRAFFEARAAEIIGRPVEFAGPLDVRLVPFPRMTAHDVRIGGAEGLGEGAERMDIRAALTPLLAGELEISQIVLTRPRLRLGLDERGGVRWAAEGSEQILPLPAERTRLERLEIVDGTLVVEDAIGGAPMEMTGLNLTGSAGTLAGPFRLEGGGLVNGRRYTVRIGTGRLQQNGIMRFTGSVAPADRPMTVELDGRLDLEADGGPRYEGLAVITRPAVNETLVPWRAEGAVVATAREIDFDRLALSIGPEAERFALEGSARLDLGARPHFDIHMAARQLDFDRAYGGGIEDPIAPAVALARLGELLEATGEGYPGRVSLEVGSVVLAGNLVENLTAELELEAEGWRILQAQAQTPGATQAQFSGNLGRFDGESELSGYLQVDSRQSGTFAGWLFGPDARIPGLGAVAGPLQAAANLNLDNEGVQFTDLAIESGDTRLGGEISYWKSPEGPSGLVVRVETDAMSLDGLRRTAGAPTLDNMVSLLGATQLDLAVDAAVVHAGAVDLHDVTLVVALDDGDVRVDRLRIGDLGGARIDGYGEITQLGTVPSGTLSLDVAADSLDALAEALAAVGLAEAGEAVRTRAAALVPVQLSLSLDAARNGEDSSRANISLTGTAAGTELDLSIDFDGRTDRLLESELAIALEATNEDGAQLVEQIGLFANPGGQMPGRIELTVRGRPESAMALKLNAAGLGVESEVDGDLRFTPRGEHELAGALVIDIADPTPLLAAANIRLPSGSNVPFSLGARLSSADGVWRLSDLSARAGTLEARGALAVDLAGAVPIAEGTVELNRLDLPWLMAALLGPDAFEADAGEGGAAWPSAAFAPASFSDMRARIGLSAPQLDLGRGFVATQAGMDLRVSPGRYAIENIEGAIFGGGMAGDLEMAGLAGAIQLEGRFDVEGVQLEELVWRSQGRPLAAGSLSGGMDVSASGRSLLGLISTLSGSGSVRVEDGVIRRKNPRAFDHIVRAADAGLELDEDEVREVFASHLDAGSLLFDHAEGSVSVAGGVVRTRNIRLDGAELSSFASASLDLARLRLESEWSLRVDAPDAEGRTREAAILYSGAIEAPERDIDVAPLLGYLTVRAFEQEVERLEELQSEIEQQELRRSELRRFTREGRRFEQEREDRIRRAQEDVEADETEEEAASGAEAQGAREPQAEAPAAEPAPSPGALEQLIREALRATPGESPGRQEPVPETSTGGQPINIVPPFAIMRDAPPATR